MGSGSSRSGRIPRRRRRNPDRRQAGPAETVPEGGTADQAPTAAAQQESGRDPSPATSPCGREETLRLLDQLLAESEAWGPREASSRDPARLPPASISLEEYHRDRKSQPLLQPLVSPEKKIKDKPENSCAPEVPGSSHKRPEGQSIIYDYSEEELMASIEQEYCR